MSPELERHLAELLVTQGLDPGQLRRTLDAVQRRRRAGDAAVTLASQLVESELCTREQLDQLAGAHRFPSIWAGEPAGASARQALRPGGEVAGFRLEAELGRGGMGAVYRAIDPAGRAVALKVMLGQSPNALGRFAREAKAAQALEHPGIVRVLGALLEHQPPLLALELVEGKALDELLAAGALTRGERLALFEQVCAAVQHAHERGVIHRDLKPGNVLVTPEGRARVTDFGLARELGRETRLTKTGSLLGTPYYMAPEQVRGAKRAGPPADVFSLGVLLYELLCDERPFTGDNQFAIMTALLQEEPPPPSRRAAGIPPALDAACLSALAKEEAERPSAGELGAAVAAARDAAPPRAGARSGSARWAGALLALGALVAGGGAWLARQGASASTDSPRVSGRQPGGPVAGEPVVGGPVASEQAGGRSAGEQAGGRSAGEQSGGPSEGEQAGGRSSGGLSAGEQAGGPSAGEQAGGRSSGGPSEGGPSAGGLSAGEQAGGPSAGEPPASRARRAAATRRALLARAKEELDRRSFAEAGATLSAARRAEVEAQLAGVEAQLEGAAAGRAEAEGGAARASVSALEAELVARRRLLSARLADLELDLRGASRELQALGEDSGAPAALRYQALLRLAEVADPLSNPQGALSCYQLARRVQPRRWEAPTRAGLLLLYSGQLPRSAPLLREALQLERSAEALTNAATYLWSAARELPEGDPRRARAYAESLAQVEEAIRLEPRAAEPRSIQAWLLRQGGEAERAREAAAAERALELFLAADDDEAYFARRGRELLASGDPRGLPTLRRALGRNRRHPLASAELAGSLLRRAEQLALQRPGSPAAVEALEGAQGQLAWAWGLNTRYGRTAALRGRAELLAGRADRARSWLERALKLGRVEEERVRALLSQLSSGR